MNMEEVIKLIIRNIKNTGLWLLPCFGKPDF